MTTIADKATYKARYIGRYYGKGYDRDSLYTEFEYRGMTYIVYQNFAKGNEPVAQQHWTEQARIDKILDRKETKGELVTTDDVYKILGWD